MSEESWISIGFRFGLGFWAAGAVFSIVGALLTWFVLTREISTAASRANASADRAAAVMGERAKSVSERFREPEIVEIPPRSVEACKALTGGQINEEFARCRQGYMDKR